MNREEYLEKHKGSFIPAVVCYLIDGDKVLLGRRFNTTLGNNFISGIGGKINKNETEDEALIREAKEEIDITIEEYIHMGRVHFIYPHKPTSNMMTEVYLVTKWDGIPKKADKMDPYWFNKNDLPVDQMWKDNKFWVPKVLKGEKVDAVFIHDENGSVIEL